MALTFREPTKRPTCDPTAGLDRQMRIDMQQEKVTDDKRMKALQQQPMMQYPTSLKLSGSQPRKR